MQETNHKVCSLLWQKCECIESLCRSLNRISFAYDSGNAMMETPHLEVLKDLKARGLLVAAPPRDDDDAYALTIARREDVRSHNRGGGGGFVMSNDMFRDAVNRDVTGELREWLTKGSGNGPGRISFAFCDMGSTDDYGDPEMDILPNPRHKLVAWIEGEHRKASSNGY